MSNELKDLMAALLVGRKLRPAKDLAVLAGMNKDQLVHFGWERQLLDMAMHYSFSTKTNDMHKVTVADLFYWNQQEHGGDLSVTHQGDHNCAECGKEQVCPLASLYGWEVKKDAT